MKIKKGSKKTSKVIEYSFHDPTIYIRKYLNGTVSARSALVSSRILASCFSGIPAVGSS